MKLAILITLAIVFTGCNDETTVQDFKTGKELSCSYNTLFTYPTIINNKTWEYSTNLEVFYNTLGSSFPVDSCDSN